MKFTHVLIDHSRSAVYLVANVVANVVNGEPVIDADYVYLGADIGPGNICNHVFEGRWREDAVSIVKLESAGIERI